MTTTKQQYLTEFRNASNSETQLRFLARWCEEEGRDFKKLRQILNMLEMLSIDTQSFQNYLQNSLVRYLDVKYNVFILRNKEGIILKIY